MTSSSLFAFRILGISAFRRDCRFDRFEAVSELIVILRELFELVLSEESEADEDEAPDVAHEDEEDDEDDGSSPEAEADKEEEEEEEDSET